VKTRRASLLPLAFIGPAALVMAAVTLYPILYGIGMAFTDFSVRNLRHQDPHFVGLANFWAILGGSDALGISFPRILGFNLLWTVVNLAFHVSLGVGLAMLLDRPGLRGSRLYRAALILPWAVPTYVTSLTWRNMFDAQSGAVNLLLASWGIQGPDWFAHFGTAFAAVLTTNIWLGFPFMMMVTSAGLKAIPRETQEAAALDGASAWQRFRHVTLPQLRPTLVPAILMGFIWTFNQFNVLYFVGKGEPLGQTEILVTQAYRFVDPLGLYGTASAFALIIFVILLGFTLLQLRLTRAVEDR